MAGARSRSHSICPLQMPCHIAEVTCPPPASSPKTSPIVPSPSRYSWISRSDDKSECVCAELAARSRAAHFAEVVLLAGVVQDRSRAIGRTHVLRCDGSGR